MTGGEAQQPRRPYWPSLTLRARAKASVINRNGSPDALRTTKWPFLSYTALAGSSVCRSAAHRADAGRPWAANPTAAGLLWCGAGTGLRHPAGQLGPRPGPAHVSVTRDEIVTARL
jgi:hypothetical protein